MKTIALAAGLALVSFSGPAAAETYPDLGRALAAFGFTGSVWVNSFNTQQQSYLAHGVFSPGQPISPAGNYEARYGMAITGSGTVSVDPVTGTYMATGTAHNPNPIPSDGSVSIDLLSNGNLADGGSAPFNCPASSDCAWTVRFQTRPPLSNPSVRVYRHVEGSRCGGELSIDLNGTCRGNLISYFNLPPNYHFTATDNIDTNYASKPGATTSALCAVVIPACANPVGVPVSDFTWSPSAVYLGSPVSFTDQSTNSPTGWSWTFQGGSPATAGIANPVVSFSSVGPKTVTLTASNAQGAGNPASKIVTVLDPGLAGTVTASAASVTQCQPVTFTANVTGAPPLTYSWQVLNPGSQTVTPPGVVAGGPTFSWTSQPAQPPGTYTGRLTVKNSSNPAGLVLLSPPVQLTALPALSDISGVAPVTDAFTASVVYFTAPAYNGATLVVWDYGDGRTDTFTDPLAGRTPAHTYALPGSYTAKVTISNCVSPGGSTSRTVSIQIAQTAPLVAAFQAALFCQLGQCFATAGTAVSFNDTSQGADLRDYDWTHTGTAAQTCNFTDSGHTSPVPSHTYATAGTFQPCLRVRRGAGEQNVAVHVPIVVGPAGPSAAITVSGITSGLINQPYVFSGLASNCTATAAGWTWTVTGGGIVSGPATGSQVTVSWATGGTKSVSAANSGCSGALGSQAVLISASSAQFTVSPAAPKAGDTVAFDSGPSTGIPAGSSFAWSFGDGGVASGPAATHVYAATGDYEARLAISPPGCINPACSITAVKTLRVDPIPGGAQFTVSTSATQEVTFDASSSTGVVAGSLFGWDFGDGSPAAFGKIVLHTYAAQSSYKVVLAISPPGCTSASCLLLAVKTVVAGPPPLTADFSSDASCTGDQCQTQATRPVTLTAAASDATAYAWSFGDGATGNGPQVTHSWAQPGAYAVSMTAVRGSLAATKTRTFGVGPPPPPTTRTALLPLAVDSHGVPVQSSDLYVNNPGATPLEVTFAFRQRGAPSVNPPQASRTLQPGTTLFVPNVLSGLFHVQNAAGFITVVTAIDKAEPVITSFNSQGATAGKLFSLALPGTPVEGSGSATASAPPRFLVGLHDTAARQSSLGFDNPAGDTATYRLRFYDAAGNLLKESPDLILAGHDQRLFGVQEIRDSFGIRNLDDYRVEVRSVSGAPVVPFVSDVRSATGDPSFSEPGSSRISKLYLLGVFTGAGAANSTWQTDLLLFNAGDQPVQTTLTFNGTGNTVKTAHTTVPPGSTQRLENALFTQFALRNGTGVVTLASTSPNGIFPAAGAETYDNTNPARRYGQTLVALSDTDAADVGKKAVLAGLRQDAANKTTLWILNPSGVAGVYDVIYRRLDGTVLGTLAGTRIAAGQLIQISPSQHPLRKAGVPGGFTVEVVVKSGKALAAAQVVRAATNDPAFIAAEVR